MNYRMVIYVRPSGERFCSLINAETGLPLVYPSLFVIAKIRNQSLSYSSVESVVGALKTGYEFFDCAGINIYERITTKKFLAEFEMSALRDWCQNKKVAVPSNVVLMGGKKNTHAVRLVSANWERQRLTHIANYISWLSDVLLDIGLDTATREAINKCCNSIRALRPDKNNRILISDRDDNLSDEDLDLTFSILHPNSDANKTRSQGICARNYLMLYILNDTGMRSGEMLGLKIGDFDLRCTPSTVKVIRRADEPCDSRPRQPLVKTNERIIPLSDDLAALVDDYIKNHRKQVPNANKHPYLVVSHRNGNQNTQGSPLSISSYQTTIANLRRSIWASISGKTHFTGHKFRKAWNRRFSEMHDMMPSGSPFALSPAAQQLARCEVMGWNPDSEMAKIYNRRFIQEQAQRATLELAKKLRSRTNKESDYGSR